MATNLHVLIFFVNGRKIVDPSPDPSLTLLSYLRRKLLLTGTKLGCGEGGCGACTVMVSKFDRKTKKIRHYSMNACLAPVCSMHGLAVTTVEGIGNTGSGLHPVQERIAKAHGSQCGFCTPGIVMSMYALLRNKSKPDEEDIETAFQGNLCRCTGYRPILQGYKTFVNGCCGNPENCCMNGVNGMNGDNCKNGVNGVNETDDEIETSTQLFDPTEWAPYDPSQDLIFPPELQLTDSLDESELIFRGKYVTWYRPTTLKSLVELKAKHPEAKIVIGNTEVGVEMKFKHMEYPHIICATHIHQLNEVQISDKGIFLGASVTLATLEDTINGILKTHPDHKTRTLVAIKEMLFWFAGPQIRNVAAVGGNIMTASPISDLNPIFVASGTKLTFINSEGNHREIFMDDNFFLGYRKLNTKADEILVNLHVPFTKKMEFFYAYKQAHRREDDIAIVNAGMRVLFKDGTDEIQKMSFSFGGMAPTTVLAKRASSNFVGRHWDESLLTDVVQALEEDLPLSPGAPGGSEAYRRTLTISFFFRFYLTVAKQLQKILADYNINMDDRDQSALGMIHRGVSKGSQLYECVPKGQKNEDPVGRPLIHMATLRQVCGEAAYVDDMVPTVNELYMAPVYSTKAHAKILSVDSKEALTMDGVVGYIDHRDVQGTNIYATLKSDDEKVFAEDEVICQGQMIGCVLADNQENAQRAARQVKVEYQPLPEIITIEQAIKAGSFDKEESSVARGDMKAAFAQCEHVIEGELWIGGQEHFYLETNSILVVPKEAGEIEAFISTQNHGQQQRIIAAVTNVPCNRVVVRVKRLGGGFGGKETRCSLIVAPTAVAARKFGRPVRCMFDRDEDMLITGGRHPCLFKYKAGSNKSGELIALDLKLYYNAGHSVDLSHAVICCGVLKVFNCYQCPNLTIQGYRCITNLPSNTAFRGFGFPQSMFVMETIMSRLAVDLNIPETTIRELNFFETGYQMAWGTELKNVTTQRCWKACMELSKYHDRHAEVEQYNKCNRWKKRGIFIMPMAYGCSFEKKFLNQGGALVMIYLDGSVLITTGGVEMGQGLHTKLMQVASRELGITVDKCYTSEAATDKVPNSISTAASFSTDLYGRAVIDACNKLNEHLKPFKEANPDGKWEDWINAAYFDGVSLSATGFFHEPDVDFDWSAGTGNPFSYYSYGTACSEVEIDCLTGDHVVRKVDIVMDVGSSINPAIDIGQIEGGFMQGYGLYVLEEHRISPEGTIYTRGPGSYKIPGFADIPEVLNVHLLKGSQCEHKHAVYSSKAIGEPPLLLALSVPFAIREAIKSARSDAGLSGYFRMDSPATAERIRMACQDQFTQKFPMPPPGSYKPWDVQI